ncbi:hypothetical protein J3F84DRAFT_16547 [Trichoderma pleuroticola]
MLHALLMLALNRALTEWHDNSPFNSPPPLAVTLSLHLHLLFHLLILSSNLILHTPLAFVIFDSSPPPPRWHSPAVHPSCPRRDSPDGPLAPPPPLICSDPCSSLEKEKNIPVQRARCWHNPRPVGRRHWAIQRCMQHAACTQTCAQGRLVSSRPLCGDF